MHEPEGFELIARDMETGFEPIARDMHTISECLANDLRPTNATTPTIPLLLPIPLLIPMLMCVSSDAAYNIEDSRMQKKCGVIGTRQ